mmetsp:Transcript_58735/g.86111  ORF Transcript_58735/g.86111 Transcript_58735/m.86111 type:complete len:111 (-) Transcript_58735:48-380(-)
MGFGVHSKSAAPEKCLRRVLELAGLDVNQPASFPIDKEGVATQQVTPMHLLVQGNFTSGAQMLLNEPTILDPDGSKGPNAEVDKEPDASEVIRPFCFKIIQSEDDEDFVE